MNREQAKSLIQSLVDSHRDGEYSRLQAAKAIGCRPENPLFEAMSKMETLAIKAVSELIGDTSESVEWFVWENDCGGRGHEHSIGTTKVMRKIRTVDDLLDAIGGFDGS